MGGYSKEKPPFGRLSHVFDLAARPARWHPSKSPPLHWDQSKLKGRPFYYYAYGAAVSEVVVDTLTGEWRLLRADVLHDAGRSINPAIDIGQVEGAFIQGMGWLTTEELWWNKNGKLMTHAPSTYKIPTINDKATDFKAILTKIKGKKPDVIMYGGMDATGGPFAKQAKELGITAKIVGGDGVCTDKVAELAGDAIDNIVCSEAGLALSKMEKGADFEKKYQARFNTPVQIYAPFTYDAVNVIIDAMKRANSTDAAKILAAMPATNYNGVIGNIAFDDKGDLKQGSITLYNYKDKKKSVLDVVKM